MAGSSKDPMAPRADAIRDCFKDYQFVATELSKLPEDELVDPAPLLSLPDGQMKNYLYHMCTTLEMSLQSLYNMNQKLERDIQAKNVEFQNATAVSQEEIQNNQTRNAELLQVNTGLLKQVHELQAAAVAGFGGTPRQSKRTLRDPEPFKGEKTNALTRQEEYMTWKQGLEMCWMADAGYYDTEQKKLLHLVSLLEGAARQERQADINGIIHGPNPFATATDLLTKLDNLYISVDVEREATIKFDKLTMNEKHPFSTFYVSLKRLGALCHKSDRELVLAMKNKVTLQLREMFKLDSHPCAADDVEGWKNNFQIWDQNCRENEHFHSSKGSGSHSTPASTPASEDPMDLDAMKNLSKEQRRDEERRLGLCHYCKETGHSVWDCGKKAVADAKKAAYEARTGSQPRGGYQGNNRGTSQALTRGNYTAGRGSFTRGNYTAGRGFYYPNAAYGYGNFHQLRAQGFIDETPVDPSDSASNTPWTTSSPPAADHNQGKA